MTTQCSINRIKNFYKVGSTFYLVVEMTTIIDNNTGAYTDVCTATSTSINPLVPNWKSRVRTAAVDRAFELYGLVVDTVLFPDFGILGV